MKDTDTIRLSPEMEAELREVLEIELDPLTIDQLLTSGELPT